MDRLMKKERRRSASDQPGSIRSAGGDGATAEHRLAPGYWYENDSVTWQPAAFAITTDTTPTVPGGTEPLTMFSLCPVMLVIGWPPNVTVTSERFVPRIPNPVQPARFVTDTAYRTRFKLRGTSCAVQAVRF